MFTGNPQEIPIPETLHSTPGGHAAASGNSIAGSRSNKSPRVTYTFLEPIELVFCKLMYSVYP
jgi:hypothetical protein